MAEKAQRPSECRFDPKSLHDLAPGVTRVRLRFLEGVQCFRTHSKNRPLKRTEDCIAEVLCSLF